MEIGSIREAALELWRTMSSLLMALITGLWPLNKDQSESLRGKRVLVTGASQGLGEQLAYRYARLGAQVAVTARREDVLKQVTERCSELSPMSDVTHLSIPADMSDLDSCQKVIEDAVSRLGGLDVLILNHITPSDIKPFTGSEKDLVQFHRNIDVNLNSYIHLTAHALPNLEANKGTIVVINSLLGTVSHPYLASYSACKHGLNGFFKCLRNQFVATESPVSVTMCHLGFIGTESAIKGLNQSGSDHLLQTVNPACPKDTAREIVKAANERRDNLYYPYWMTRPLCFMNSLMPTRADKIMRDSSQQSTQV